MTVDLDQYLISKEGCQWMDGDPRIDDTKCLCETVHGTSWCADHYSRVYAKGTSVNGRRKNKAIDDEIANIKKQTEEVNE